METQTTSFMSKVKSWHIVVAIGVLVLLYVWSTYNSLVTKSLAVNGAWAEVENQFQRRFDLIPNLVNAVSGISNQEQEIFLGIAEARKGYSGASTVEEKVAASQKVESALGRLLAVVESYPNLRSAETVDSLMTELTGTENRVTVGRQRYNDAVGSYNNITVRFPSKVVASMFGFEPKSFFEAEKGADKPVAVPKKFTE